MAQDVIREAEIKNCLEFFFPSASPRISKQEGCSDTEVFFCMAYFPTSFLFAGHAEGSVTVLLFPVTAWICPLPCVSPDFIVETH